MQAVGTLKVNAFEFWHARCLSGLVWLAEDLICAPLYGLYSGRRSDMFRSLKMRASLKLNQSAERNFLSTVAVFKSPGVNVTDLCRNSFAEQN